MFRSVCILELLLALGGTAVAAAPEQNRADPVLDGTMRTFMDRPIGTARVALPPRPNDVNGPGVVRCFYYPDFTVKELDYGDHGDTALSLTPAKGPARPACGKQDDPGEKLAPDGVNSIFAGSVGGYAFIQSTFGGNGLGRMFIYDGRSGKRLYQGIWSIKGPAAVSIQDGVLGITVVEGTSSECSILVNTAACWARLARRGLIPPAVASQPPPLAACEAAYKQLQPFTGLSPRSDPSVLTWQVRITLDKAGQLTQTGYGPVMCSPSE